jgi:hypothetical protein
MDCEEFVTVGIDTGIQCILCASLAKRIMKMMRNKKHLAFMQNKHLINDTI